MPTTFQTQKKKTKKAHVVGHDPNVKEKRRVGVVAKVSQIPAGAEARGEGGRECKMVRPRNHATHIKHAHNPSILAFHTPHTIASESRRRKRSARRSESETACRCQPNGSKWESGQRAIFNRGSRSNRTLSITSARKRTRTYLEGVEVRHQRGELEDHQRCQHRVADAQHKGNLGSGREKRKKITQR